jgi:hypothetical protein
MQDKLRPEIAKPIFPLPRPTGNTPTLPEMVNAFNAIVEAAYTKHKEFWPVAEKMGLIICGKCVTVHIEEDSK